MGDIIYNEGIPFNQIFVSILQHISIHYIINQRGVYYEKVSKL